MLEFFKTQGAEISSKIVSFESRNKDVEMFFFDVAGQDLYKSFVYELVLYLYFMFEMFL